MGSEQDLADIDAPAKKGCDHGRGGAGIATCPPATLRNAAGAGPRCGRPRC
jgi:hypothetical protein